ncbi:MAG TPA: type II toxin-antitoxin system VapB family antitoxin [Planctomycetota bacterium]|nr:type II toxin-antitoxin system VapB family antitoxin [Planctomycetota bacterium]
MAKTVVNLDEKLLRRARKLSGVTKKVSLVNWGLEVLVEHLEQMEILKSKGKVKWEGDLDEMRGRVRR